MIIGRFINLYDEEYIARSFESLGHEVLRANVSALPVDLTHSLNKFNPDILLFNKWSVPDVMKPHVEAKRKNGMKTVCWVFDLYFNYPREHLVKQHPMFRADYVFTTDGGHDERWADYGINHKCVRQGIYKPHCYVLEPRTATSDVVFVGSESPIYPQRNETILKLAKKYKVRWFGRNNTNEARNDDLNMLYSMSKIVIGDSYPSPRYWSNRVVETLGRGGFLIHRNVAGIKEEYPYLVTYDGTFEDLCEKIDYYLEHEDERRELIQKNYEWVKNRYTMDKKCQELLDYVNN